uniref:LD21589p n=1 Tax=Drosophila melanogaster TaxID=7227 RepID=Q8T090_DROME|nr:LD21589p [Drosophila melanogaster]
MLASIRGQICLYLGSRTRMSCCACPMPTNYRPPSFSDSPCMISTLDNGPDKWTDSNCREQATEQRQYSGRGREELLCVIFVFKRLHFVFHTHNHPTYSQNKHQNINIICRDDVSVWLKNPETRKPSDFKLRNALSRFYVKRISCVNREWFVDCSGCIQHTSHQTLTDQGIQNQKAETNYKTKLNKTGHDGRNILSILFIVYSVKFLNVSEIWSMLNTV